VDSELLFEDVEIGSAIPTLIKHPTTRQLVKWAGAVDKYNEFHFDKDVAQSAGLPGVVVNGVLEMAFLMQQMTDWIGKRGTLKKLGCSYRGLLFPGEDAICKGRVTNKYIQDGEHYIDCEVWVENPRGEKTAVGTSTVVLSSRADKGRVE